MIVQLVLDIVLGALTGILGLVPTFTVPASVTNFGTSMGSAVAGANGVFPVVTLGVVIGALLALRLAMFVWHGIVFVYKLIPLKGT